MTVAQFAYPAHSFARHSRRAWFRALRQTTLLHQAATQYLSRDVALWRAIAIGMGFAATGFAIIASALAS